MANMAPCAPVCPRRFLQVFRQFGGCSSVLEYSIPELAASAIPALLEMWALIRSGELCGGILTVLAALDAKPEKFWTPAEWCDILRPAASSLGAGGLAKLAPSQRRL